VLVSEATPASPEPQLQAPRPLLPEEPLVVIEASNAWVPVNVRDLWTYRELLYHLAWRDLKVRYKQTVMGIIWIVVQPLLMTVIFTLFLGKLARVPSSGQNIPYAIFAYAGLLIWTFFSGAISVGGQSLLGNAHLITKIYFPRIIIPCAVIVGRLIDLAISLALLAVLMLFFRVPVTRFILFIPIPLALVVLLALGFSMLTAALNVRYRDVGIALPVLIQLWMFTSPVVYPASLVPQRWRGIYALNPLVGILENFRASLFGGIGFNWTSLAIAIFITLGLLVYSAYAFRRADKSFADLL
jgi:lipopolysaccharide transport system permease protein